MLNKYSSIILGSATGFSNHFIFLGFRRFRADINFVHRAFRTMHIGTISTDSCKFVTAGMVFVVLDVVVGSATGVESFDFVAFADNGVLALGVISAPKPVFS